MKKYFHFLLVVLIIPCCSFGQNLNKNKIHISQFNWTINIPQGYAEVPPEIWEDQQIQGEKLIEKTFKAKLIKQTVTLFVYQNDDFNSIESNYKPFDQSTDSDYVEAFDVVNYILYETLITQMPGIKVKKKRGTKKIDNLLFQSFEMKITYPNKIVVHFLMFSKLFNNEELTINIIYADNKQGELMKNALFNSTFGK